MFQCLFTAVGTLVDQAKGLFGRRSTSCVNTNAAAEIGDFDDSLIDKMLTDSIKIAYGLVARGVERPDWEVNLRGIEDLLITESQLDPKIAQMMVEFARELLHKYGDQPELLAGMLETPPAS